MLAAELGLLQPQEDRSMALVDIETGLGDHELAVRDAAHKFAEEIMRPERAEFGWRDDPAESSPPTPCSGT